MRYLLILCALLAGCAEKEPTYKDVFCNPDKHRDYVLVNNEVVKLDEPREEGDTLVYEGSVTPESVKARIRKEKKLEDAVIFEFDGCVECGGPCEGHPPKDKPEEFSTKPATSGADTITLLEGIVLEDSQGEVFKAVDTYDPEKYYTIAEGLKIDGYRCLYVPWGTAMSCSGGFVYKKEAP